jgi:acylphosphatase
MTTKTVRALISGKVQGVWYRAWTEKTAIAHGLDGWVRNLPDGRVEALFSGEAAPVEAMLADCRDGPPLARVSGIETTEADPPAAPGFTVR